MVGSQECFTSMHLVTLPRHTEVQVHNVHGCNLAMDTENGVLTLRQSEYVYRHARADRFLLVTVANLSELMKRASPSHKTWATCVSPTRALVAKLSVSTKAFPGLPSV
jgi:hypothetical protein